MSGCQALIYIHGFTSSPQSQKAVATRTYLEKQQIPVEFRCPQLSDHPGEAMRQLELEIAACSSTPALIGSSLGGFYASHLTEKYDLYSALINPAVAPTTLIAKFLGPNTNPYTGVEFILTEADIAVLAQLEVPLQRARERSLVLLETGDETLNYCDALLHYDGVPTLVEQGGDHRCQSYERYLPFILQTLAVEI